MSSPRTEHAPEEPHAPDPRATGRLSALIAPASQPTARHTPVSPAINRRAALLYIGAATLWVTASDALLNRLIPTPALRDLAQTGKGIVFILASGAALYALLRRHLRALHRVERQVVARDAHIGRIIDTMANGVALLNLEGVFVDTNPALCDLLHTSPDRLLGTSFGDLMQLDKSPGLPLAVALDRARTDGRFTLEVIRYREDGSHVEVRLTLAPLYDGQTHLTGYVADHLNIGDVRRAEAHLEGIGGVIEDLASEQDLHVLGRKAVAAAVRLTDFETGAVAIHDPDLRAPTYRWCQGLEHLGISPDDIASEPRDRELAARFIGSGTSHSIDLSLTPDPALQPYRELGFKSITSVPIESEGHPGGALLVGTHSSNRSLDAGQLAMLQAVARQIGVALHRHQLLHEARASEARFRNVVDTVPDILYRAELPHFATSFISPAAERLLGYPSQAFYNDPQLWRSRIHPDDLEHITETIATAIDHDETYVVRYRCRHRDDQQILWFEDHGHVERQSDMVPTGITGVISDITAQKKAEDRLTFLAYHDSLTTLPNRHGLIRAIDHWTGEHPEAPAVLLYIDLDRFHLVNDILGHDAGDTLLLDARDRLQAILPTDALLARIGADEFVAFLPSDLSPGELRAHTSAILSSFSRPFTLKGQDSYLSASIGVATWPRDASEAKALIKHAHLALAHAKESGPASCSFYAGEIATRQQRRLSLQSRLHRAMVDDEITVAYQPIIDLRSGKITGAEALLRWTTTTGEVISPADFIPAAEESGLILPLGDWVLSQVCQQIRSWRSAGLDLSVAVNLSPLQFLRGDIVERILAAISDAHIPPGRLALELTESAMLADPDHSIRVVHRLREHGLRVAIDDFGTGYSSLERLKQLPVQILKIDRSFVKDLPGDHRDANIVRSIVTLSQNFQMKALAEGIESAAQWTLLRDMGCQYGQGFFFSPAISPEHLFEKATRPPIWNAPRVEEAV
ncbi:hypothetical protein DL240_06065 [Lujinxingia litoralis]|uniref:Diguanylate cyclase n=1 Tax=Lujinxingia litoralis TaxID=2211119 RepID=A0A328C820_9DELT|nr:GGDEF domain-containing phosphodiesterase [Lujinxingia litoralis]RAL23720.1 hypothetical protein DL240_06065 [Lujinxingia litoralis]